MSEADKQRAEKAFKKAEAERQGTKAMADHQAKGVAVRENMAKLREQRLAREAEAAKVSAPPPARKTKKRP